MNTEKGFGELIKMKAKSIEIPEQVREAYSKYLEAMDKLTVALIRLTQPPKAPRATITEKRKRRKKRT